MAIAIDVKGGESHLPLLEKMGAIAQPAPGFDPERDIYRIELEVQNEELRQALLAETGLRKQYAELFNAAPVGYVMLSKSGLIRKANQLARSMFSLAWSELAQAPICRFIASLEEQNLYYRQFQKLLASGEPRTCALTIKKRAGEALPVQLHMSLAPDEREGLTILATLSAIAPRPQTPPLPPGTACDFTTIMAAVSESIFVIDPQGLILELNATAAARFGRTVRELQGRIIYDLLPPGLAAARKQMIELAVANRQASTFTDARDGRNFLTVIFPVFAPAGQLLRIIIFAQDIQGTLLQTMDSLVLKLQAEQEQRLTATAELQNSKAAADRLGEALRQANDGLSAVMQARDREVERMREEVLTSLKQMVLPVVDKLKKSALNQRQLLNLETIEANLGSILQPLGLKAMASPAILTRMEMQVANLIKQGKSTLEIARFFNLSPRTIESHRKAIRKKLRIPSRSISMRNHLLSCY